MTDRIMIARAKEAANRSMNDHLLAMLNFDTNAWTEHIDNTMSCRPRRRFGRK